MHGLRDDPAQRDEEVAALLGTSIHTVRKQAIGVYAKLRVGGRAQLAALIARDRTGDDGSEPQPAGHRAPRCGSRD
jgi:hypothetical protein